MLSNNDSIKSIIAEDIVKTYAEKLNISLKEASAAISKMNFKEYLSLVEANVVVPPSGQTIAPTTGPTQQSSPQQQAGTNKMKSIWPGKGSPIERGMTVGLKGPNGLPVPGEITQVDMGAKGVKVKNPTTGQEEWQNQDALEPFMAQGQAQGTQSTAEDVELQRMRTLAGIKENCSAGATGAGAIAVAPASMGKVKKRQQTEEQKIEYTPRTPPKTIAGDTKPNQATGLLSATLAANGKKTASRKNNGFKK